MPVTYEELVAKANQHAKNLQVEEVEHLAKIWRSFDLNGDEVIQVREVEQFLKGLKLNMPQSKREQLIKELDRNGDGTISFVEFVHTYNRGDLNEYKELV